MTGKNNKENIVLGKKDILAIIIVLYKIILPQLVIISLAFYLFSWLLMQFWLN